MLLESVVTMMVDTKIGSGQMGPKIWVHDDVVESLA